MLLDLLRVIYVTILVKQLPTVGKENQDISRGHTHKNPGALLKINQWNGEVADEI